MTTRVAACRFSPWLQAPMVANSTRGPPTDWKFCTLVEEEEKVGYIYMGPGLRLKPLVCEVGGERRLISHGGLFKEKGGKKSREA